jgi:hypothetical protein
VRELLQVPELLQELLPVRELLREPVLLRVRKLHLLLQQELRM